MGINPGKAGHSSYANEGAVATTATQCAQQHRRGLAGHRQRDRVLRIPPSLGAHRPGRQGARSKGCMAGQGGGLYRGAAWLQAGENGWAFCGSLLSAGRIAVHASDPVKAGPRWLA